MPDNDPERPWTDAEDLCAAWTLARASEEGVNPVLVAGTLDNVRSGGASVQRIVRYEAVTPRSARPSFMGRPTLAFVPNYNVMDLAIRCARGSHLAVVETVAWPLLGWAMEVGAVDLEADAVTADTRSAEARDLLDGIHFYGNNGWGPDFDRRQASRLLADLRGRGELDRAVVLGHMVARGHGGKSIDRLDRLIGSV